MVTANKKRVVVLTGVTGVDVGSIADYAKRQFDVETMKFEEFVEEEFNAPVYHAIELLLINRRSAIEKFIEAFNKMTEAIKASNSEAILVTFHLTYHRRRHIVPNPILPLLGRLPGLHTVIYYIEDYYHALTRLAQRAEKGYTPGVARNQALDPVAILYWRAADQSMLTLLKVEGVNVYIIANKHSREQHTRLLADALGVEYGGVEKFRKVYISHPITKVRMKALAEGIPLPEHPDAKEIEEFKETISRKCKDLILFSPTTIDELIVDAKGEMKIVIDYADRWPHSKDTIHKDYKYPINLADELFDRLLYPTSETVLNKGYMNVVRNLIQTQIESRDMAYVTQSDFLIAYRPTMYGELHMGVDMEVRVAVAQAKPVYAVIPHEEEPRHYPSFNFWYALSDIDELFRALRCG